MAQFYFDDLDENKCPVCGCPEVVPYIFEKLQGKYYVSLKCPDCKASWGLQLSGETDAFFDIEDAGGDVLAEWVE
jgi:hypothetical protein